MGCCWSSDETYASIIKNSDATTTIDRSSKAKFNEQLYSGVFLHGRTQKFWVDKHKMSKNCFMVFARALEIANNDCYTWHEETSEYGKIELAEMGLLCHFEAKGSLNIANLSPCTPYEVAYLIKLNESSFGWEGNVKLTLDVNGKKQEREECLQQKEKGIWLRILVGKFSTCKGNEGKIEFSISGPNDKCKRGLVIKGVVIEPMTCL